MTKRIFRSIGFVAIAVFLASLILIMGVLYDYFSGVQQRQLQMQLELAAQGVTNEETAYFDDLKVRDYRITWIAADGTVLYDSDALSSDMENHLEREEIKEALATGHGESRRYSATLMDRSLYAAQRLEDGTVLRLSIAQSSILTLVLGMAQPISIVIVLAVVLSVVLAIRLSKNIVKPLNEIDLDHPLSNEGYDELAPFLRRIDSQQKQLRRQKTRLEQKQAELDTIIGSMSEGMVLLNEHGKIVSINPAAMALLGVEKSPVGADMLTVSRNLSLNDILRQTLQGQSVVETVSLETGQYQISASPIMSEGKVAGAALCFFDVTEKEKAEQMRREFTSNVSHELKTPLHSISGYAELLQNNMVKQGDIVPFAGKIYREAQRMTSLVEDILSLSHLDEGAEDMEWTEVDLYELAAKAIAGLEAEAKAAEVKMSLHGEYCSLHGVPQLLHSILYNLCDNAIKYNKNGGEVTVSVERQDADAVLTVSDMGIGIPAQEQARIFERFYRVDKSRSKEVGGTGLGLSIVKHAVLIHHGTIEVDSTVDEGTTITVRLPI
ncbi:sensor histidine kinase [Neglectibacter caecimuris]|uniref:sensor histidine kinase n=1 Tax=Neglectibacter caecimuris TaxID=3093658 RepID=UPI002AC9254F|nr:ATP-binding protein [Neglectibacter sp. M00184]